MLQPTDPVLYILMRSDMASLNPGKMAAQACHAANMMHDAVLQAVSLDNLLQRWLSQGCGFGTTLVLDAGTEEKLLEIVHLARGCSQDVWTGSVLDSTYPITDGDVLHTLPVITCGYLFGEKRKVQPFIQGLELYR